ncbi:MMPL family transporter [Actinacidiphila bryophytorum]|uniref:Drug exporter of the RND superfamily n=1 Tax=Actinacidiphila bryophytorum TaxID=1436133 RepID=A0A9W4E415_9ACTN|nr:MMPL family transporter [Actinacidiphila bryophytorum]MBM9435333.1 MMPL family transporter [Actinacidiphila bryophytorum]MBN6542180.1 MMPL family transporter [Actinacidiphila bryophytorum]CAG7606924.1 Putative drug exporter of the RND superfamily [Actinacidiphila bryophytorum]
MTSVSSPEAGSPGRRPHAPGAAGSPGPFGRLGIWSATHARTVFLLWVVVVAVLGAFAPKVESALSGAGWQANGSQSVAVRQIAQDHFGGNASSAIQVVVHADKPVTDPSVQKVIGQAESIVRGDSRVAAVVPPQPGATVSPDGHTAIVLAGAKADPNEMVRAADDLKEPLAALSGQGVTVNATGASVLWSDFNTANHSAMIHSEILSWPVTLVILVLAFGSLVAAGLPLLLTMAGLGASAGSLVLLTHLTPVSIWAMNFAMMFALALGIDYALFMVMRFRGARMGRARTTVQAVAETMDTAGKAVALSGATVLVSLSAVMLVPSPAFRSMAGGIMLAVAFVLAATLTLLPAVLAKLGHRIDAAALPWAKVGEHRSPRFAAWGERLWRRPVAYGAGALVVLLALAAPVIGLRTAMPSINVLPGDASARAGYTAVQNAFGPGAPGTLQIAVPSVSAPQAAQTAQHTPGIATVLPPQAAADHSGWTMIQAVPTADPSDPVLSQTVHTLRTGLPHGSLVGGAAVENLDLQHLLTQKTPLVIGIVLALGFLLLLIALQAPLVAALGTAASLLSTGAAFGVARLLFQDGHGAGLLGFTSQGFLDGWAPVFFFAMIFAIAMDYTVFLLASAKEHYERTRDVKDAMVGAMAHSGRVIFAAAAVMVAVFFTFAISGPLPPKEMGIVLGVAVLLDAALVRLVLLPVLLRLTGHAAWWTPSWLRRILPDVRFAHD